MATSKSNCFDERLGGAGGGVSFSLGAAAPCDGRTSRDARSGARNAHRVAETYAPWPLAPAEKPLISTRVDKNDQDAAKCI
jgi:hypothetical protein